MKKLTCLKFGWLVLSFLAHAEPPAPDFRLVVTGGLQGSHDGYEAFYASPLFRLGSAAPITIQNARLEAYAAQNTIYFSDQPIDLKQLIEGKASRSKKSFMALNASQVFGFRRVQNQLVDFKNNTLLHELGGLAISTPYEYQSIGSQTIYAVNIVNKAIYWPKRLEEFQKVNAVLALGENSEAYYFFPRDFRSTQTTFQIVDQLLKNGSPVPTRYVDLGNALTSSNRENLNVAIKMSKMLQARNPAALALGRYDLSMFPKIHDHNAYIGALVGEHAPATSKRIQIGDHEVCFAALGEISNLASAFLEKDWQVLSTKQSIERIKFQKNDLVIGLSENRNSAAEAIEYPILDMVLSLSFLRGGSLPALDDIDLSDNEKLGVRTVAPLVRISPADVTEVSVWLSRPGHIKRILINRHPIVAGISTQAQFYKPVLPDKNWKEKDFETLLANILLNTHPNSELVMIEKRSGTTPLDSSLPMLLAENLIATHGRGIQITLGGFYLKQILKAIQQDQFDIDITLTSTLQREISEAETYKLVVSEKVLAAISDFIARERLFSSTSNPSSSLQIALSESNKDAHKFLVELRKRENKISDSDEDRLQLLQNSPSMVDLVRQSILQKTPLEIRPERSILLFDISDLDFGLKLNTINDNLASWQDDANSNTKDSFDESRFWDQKYLNMLLYTKIGLYYFIPKL